MNEKYELIHADAEAIADQVADLIREHRAEMPSAVREQMEIAAAQLAAASRTLAAGEAQASDAPDAVHRAVRQGYAMSRAMMAGDEGQGIRL